MKMRQDPTNVFLLVASNGYSSISFIQRTIAVIAKIAKGGSCAIIYADEASAFFTLNLIINIIKNCATVKDVELNLAVDYTSSMPLITELIEKAKELYDVVIVAAGSETIFAISQKLQPDISTQLHQGDALMLANEQHGPESITQERSRLYG